MSAPVNRLTTRILYAFGCFAILALAAAVPASAQEAEWIVIDEAGDESYNFHLHVEAALKPGEGAVQEFPCTVMSQSSSKPAVLRLRVYDAQNTILHEGTIPMQVEPGRNRARFRWDTVGTTFSIYTLRFDLLFADKRIIGPWEEIVLFKRSEANTKVALDEFRSAIGDLESHFDRLAGQGYDPAYGRMRLVVAQHTANLADAYLAKSDWRAASDHIGYGRHLLGRVKGQLTFWSTEPELYHAPSRPSLTNLSIAGDTFMADHEYVYLYGLNGWDKLAESLDDVVDMGLNQAGLYFDPTAENTADQLASIASAIDKAASENVSVTLQITPSGMADAFTGAAQLPAAYLTLPEDVPSGDSGREMREAIIDLANLASGRPIVNSVSVMYRPMFSFRTKEVRPAFIGYLRARYEDREALNRSWMARLRDFSDVEIDSEYQRPAYTYDWNDFQLSLAERYVQGFARGIRNEGTTVRLQAAYSMQALEVGDAARVPDPENASDFLDIAGLALPPDMGESRFAINHPRQTVMVALKSAFNPNRPVFASQLFIVPSGENAHPDEFGYARTTVWELAMAGADGASAFAWAPGANDAARTIYDNPGYLEGYCAGAIDVNRLANLVHAFQKAPARIAILWSRSSRILQQGEPYLQSVIDAYEGTAFGGQQIRFISETDCANGQLEDIDMLILPRAASVSDDAFAAINEFIIQDNFLARTDTPIPYTPRGHSRYESIESNLNTLLVRGRGEATDFLHAMESAYSRGAIPQTPRAINEHGYLIEGVRSRYIERDGKSYLYLVNMRHESVTCHLYGDAQRGRDLIEGRNVTFPMDLRPLTPMIIELGGEDEGVHIATVGGTPSPPDDTE